MHVGIDGMRNLNKGRLLNNKMQKAMEKLASGFRINRAGDDAAGLAVSEKLHVELSEQEQCVQNVRHGTNLARTADAALQEVNDMMKRAEQLCLQAENGTYSELERQELSDELNALYDEMERIFSSAEFSDIKLFRYETPEDVGDFPKDLKEYIEHVEKLTPDGVYAQWGDMDIINGKKEFSDAEDAKGASVAIQLDSSVNLNDADSLNGKSFYIKSSDGGYGAYVTFSSADGATDAYKGSLSYNGSSYLEFDIATKGRTVQQALDALCSKMEANTSLSNSVRPESITVSADGLVAFEFDTVMLEQTVNGETYEVVDGKGTLSNGVKVFSTEQGTLEKVDNIENGRSYSPEGTASITFLNGVNNLDDVKEALKVNQLTVDDLTISFTAAEVDGFSSVDDVRAAIVQKINAANDPNLTAVKNGSSITIKKTDCTTDTSDDARIYETSKYQKKQTSATPAVTFSGTGATMESVESCTITIADTTLPLSMKIGNKNYTFCKSVLGGYTAGDGSVCVETSNVLNEIGYIMRSTYGYSRTQYSVSGNTITVRGKYAGEILGFSAGPGAETEVTLQQNALLSSGKYSFSQKMSTPLDLGVIDGGVSELNGRGFTYGSTLYEFNDGTEPRQTDDAVKIDTSGCTTAADIAARLQPLLDKKHGTGYVKATAIDNVLYFTTGGYYTLTDGRAGLDGLFTDVAGTKTETAAGGVDASQSGTTISFSRYNAENFDELYGTGFRVTCATCDNEFINVMFCNDKTQAEFPDSFPLLDENGDPVKDQNGRDIIIRNCVVELKDMSSGEDIVRSIVNQLSPRLDHFTEVAVGTPASVLVVRDKRQGDIKDKTTGQIRKAEIRSGVYTNCVYDLTVIKHENPEAFIGGPETNTTANFGYCAIYAGDSEGKPEWIGVRLPNLSLRKLNLDPPRPDLTDVDSIEDVRKRLRIADNVIGLARGALGADQNRLDHAKENLTVAAEQTADAYSRIRDLDMADGMTEQVKLSIMQQSQQSALAHINQQASEVLKLMQ